MLVTAISVLLIFILTFITLEQVTTPGASVPTRTNCFAAGNAPTAGLVEAWAQSTLCRETGGFSQSEMEVELVFTFRLWPGSVADGRWGQEAGFCAAGPAPSGEGLRDPTTVAAAQPSAGGFSQPRLQVLGSCSYRADSTIGAQQPHSWPESVKLNLLQVRGIFSLPCPFPVDFFALMLKGEVGHG